MITVDIYRLPLPATLRRRVVNGHILPYERHAEATVTRVRISSSRSASGANDLAWVAHAPAVAPILATVPEAFRNDILRACVVAVEQVYRIPAARRAEAERVGRAGWRPSGMEVPRRANPMVTTVNRKVVPTGKPAAWYVQDIANKVLTQISPSASAYIEDQSLNRRSKISDLCLALTLTLGSPEGFPPAPIDGERYTGEELFAIISVWLEHTGEYNRLNKRIWAYRERKATNGAKWDNMFPLPTEYDVITHGLYDAQKRPTGGPLNSYKQQLDDSLTRVTEYLQYHEAKADAADRLGEDWPDVISAVVYSAGDRYSHEQSITAAHNVEMLAQPLVSDIIRATFRHSEVQRFGGYNATLSELMKNSMASSAEYQRVRKNEEAKREREKAVLLPVLAPLLNLDRPITLADVTKRLPPGFKAETTRYGAAELTFPSGYHPSESQGIAKWDKLVRNLLARKW